MRILQLYCKCTKFLAFLTMLPEVMEKYFFLYKKVHTGDMVSRLETSNWAFTTANNPKAIRTN
jgi:stalled ribosome rescue protein Dom34